MFDIGFPELILIAVVGLLVIGPERLPEALRTLGLWLGRMRRSFLSVKDEIEKEIGMDEVRRQLHNEAVMEEMKRIESEVRDTADQAAANPAAKPARSSVEGPAQAPAKDPGQDPVQDPTQNSAPDPAEQSAAEPVPPTPANSADNGQR